MGGKQPATSFKKQLYQLRLPGRRFISRVLPADLTAARGVCLLQGCPIFPVILGMAHLSDHRLWLLRHPVQHAEVSRSQAYTSHGSYKPNLQPVNKKTVTKDIENPVWMVVQVYHVFQ